MELQANSATFRNYVFFWLGQLTSLLGSSVAQFVIIWWITIQTGSAVYLSIASFAGLIPIVVLSPFTGVFADRWNRKKLIASVDFLQALTTMVLVFLFWLDTISIWLILVLLALRGVFQAFHMPTVLAIIPTMIPKEKLSRMNGLNFLFSGAVRIVGPILAVLLLEFWEISQILWIDVITFLIALVPLLFISIPSVRKNHERTSFKTDFAEGFTFIRNTRGLLPLIILSTALNFLITPLNVLLPYFVKFDHLGGVEDLAFVIAVAQGGMLIGGILMSVKKEFKKKMDTMIPFLFLFFLAYACLALIPVGQISLIAICGFIMILCLPIVNVLYMTIIQVIVPVEIQGRVNSVDTALSTAASPIGTIASGPLAESAGTANLFFGCSLLGILTLTFSLFFTDIRHVESR